MTSFIPLNSSMRQVILFSFYRQKEKETVQRKSKGKRKEVIYELTKDPKHPIQAGAGGKSI